MVEDFEWSINALQRTAAGRRDCNRCASWPPSLGRSASVRTMTSLTKRMRRKYVRPLFAAGIDLAARSCYSLPRPDFFAIRRTLLRLTLTTEFLLLRSFSRLLGVEEGFMAFYRSAADSVRRFPSNEKPNA